MQDSLPPLIRMQVHDKTRIKTVSDVQNRNNPTNIEDYLKNSVYNILESFLENPILFLASGGLLIIFLGLLINIIYSFYNRKPIKKNKNTYKDFKMIQFHEI